MPVIICLLIVRYIYKTYNELTAFKEKVLKQASNIDVILKSKYDKIPALLDVVKQYAKHEKTTFETITKLRTEWLKSNDPYKKIELSNKIESLLSKLLIIHENYPKLKANRNYLSLQKSINSIENSLIYERKKYNRVVNWYNTRVKVFPRNIIAKLFHFEPIPYFNLERGD